MAVPVVLVAAAAAFVVVVAAFTSICLPFPRAPATPQRLADVQSATNRSFWVHYRPMSWSCFFG